MKKETKEKLRWAILLVAALAILLDFVLWWGSLGYPLHATVCDPTGKQNDCPSYNPFFAFAVLWAYDFNYWGTLVTAVATGFIAWFTFSLRAATKEQGRLTQVTADIAKDSLIVGNAAFVFVNDFAWTWSTAPDDLLGNIVSYWIGRAGLRDDC